MESCWAHGHHLTNNRNPFWILEREPESLLCNWRNVRLRKSLMPLSWMMLPDHQLKPDELLLMTIRSHDQFNTTIYGLNDRYRGIHNERRVVFINEGDMIEKGLTQLDVVDLHSNYDGIQRTAEKFLVVAYNIPKGNMAAYFPETNLLVPHNHFAEKSQTPISKSIKVTVEKIPRT
jgi:anaerobic selenocysteine-containing dehydrogenase